MIKRIISAVISIACTVNVLACTSMIIGKNASATGRPMLWKHRDTGTEHNFVERVTATTPDDFSFVGLFNGGDSLLSEAWMGFNEAGFAIMNTASYNLAPDTAKLKDCEGLVMAKALKKCRTVEDFRNMLDTLPKPLGVQANFGVIDAEGNGAYFETDDYKYVEYNLADFGDRVLYRTNYSYAGNDTDGMGYIRFDNALFLTKDDVNNKDMVPEILTEKVSRSFYHNLFRRDFEADTTARWAVDQDFIPRYSSSASIVIEGVAPGENTQGVVMWTVPGYPPVSHVFPVFIDSVPDELRPTARGWRSSAWNEAIQKKRLAFPIKRGSGKRYVDLNYIRSIKDSEMLKSAQNYKAGRIEQSKRLQFPSKKSKK